MLYGMLAIGCVTVGIFVAKRDEKGGPVALVLKALASFFFIAVAVFAYLQNEGTTGNHLYYFLLVLGGLLCGLVGDIWLDLKVTYPRHDRIFTFAGMGSFVATQSLYALAFFEVLSFDWWPIFLAIVATILIMGGATKFMKIDFGEFTLISVAYCWLLTFVLFCTMQGMIASSFSVLSVVLFCGSVMFLVSDLILSQTYFNGKESRAFIVSNHITYYLAQYLIALSLLFV